MNYVLLYILLTTTLFIRISIEYSGLFGPVLFSTSIASLFIFSIFYFSAEFGQINRAKIKQQAAKDYDQNKLDNDVPHIELDIKGVLAGKNNLLMSNEESKKFVLKLFGEFTIVIVVMIVLFQWMGYDEAKNQTQFMTTIIDGREYAVVYNTGEEVVLLSCKAENQVIYIDKSWQRIEAEEGRIYKSRNYEKVNFVDFEIEYD